MRDPGETRILGMDFVASTGRTGVDLQKLLDSLARHGWEAKLKKDE